MKSECQTDRRPWDNRPNGRPDGTLLTSSAEVTKFLDEAMLIRELSLIAMSHVVELVESSDSL
jgi:hypothetical protein